jgi:hypothetical protein
MKPAARRLVATILGDQLRDLVGVPNELRSQLHLPALEADRDRLAVT